MKLNPMPHQRLMSDFMAAHPRAGIFASMGLSKTAAVLTSLNDMFADGMIRKALVLAPLRVAKLTWPNEVEKWSESFGWMRCGYLPSPHNQIDTMNYERVTSLETLEPYDVVVMDELTKLKSASSTRARHLLTLLQARPKIRRIGLTGTPRPNSLLELHNQIRMLDDGKRLSPSFDHFRSTYFTPTDYQKYNWEPKLDAERKVYQKINDLCLTLLASDYLDIPDTIVEDVEIVLPVAAHSLYRQLERDLLLVLKGGAVVAQNAAVLVNKLLQVCSGSVYGEDRLVHDIHPSKISALLKLRQELEGENVIIFCSYIHERERVLRALGKDAVDLSTFKGDIEKAWNSGSIKDLVAHPSSLGHGLNLQQGGRTIIWFSPTWSREVYDQANARVARKGQKQITKVFRIIASGTMDEAVMETLRNRGESQGAMLALLSNWQKLGLAFK